MVEFISNDVIVASDESIPFENVLILHECGVNMHGSSALMFNESAIYMLNICAVATPSESTFGTVGIQIANYGKLQGIASVEDVTEVHAVHALALTHLVKAPALITLRNVGCDAIFDIDLVVTKIEQ